MKVLGSLFTFALLGVSAVFGQSNIAYGDTFIYQVSNSDKKATLVGLNGNEKFLSDANLRPTVMSGGITYNVNQIGSNAFANTGVEVIFVNNDIQSLHFANNALSNAKKLRSVRLNVEKVTADEGAFNNLSPLVDFEGVGARSLAIDISKKLLKSWNLPIGQDFTAVSTYEFKKNLLTLAYNVKRNFKVDNNVANPNNAVNVLALKAGSSNGIARAYRILALTMGYQYNDVHVGGDGGDHSWNYVFITMNGSPRTWYNLDIVNTDITNKYDVSFFRTKEQQKNVLQQKYGYSQYLNTDNWIIFRNEYNYPGEFFISEGQKYYYDIPRTSDFYSWCVTSRSGGIA